jgi:hypothetical protein
MLTRVTRWVCEKKITQNQIPTVHLHCFKINTYIHGFTEERSFPKPLGLFCNKKITEVNYSLIGENSPILVTLPLTSSKVLMSVHILVLGSSTSVPVLKRLTSCSGSMPASNPSRLGTHLCKIDYVSRISVTSPHCGRKMAVSRLDKMSI